MSDVKLADTVYYRFCTVNETGQAIDADSLPTVDVEEDGSSMASNGGATVTDIGTGVYRVDIPVTTGNGYEAGKRYNVMISATVDGVTSHKMIAEFLCTSHYPADIAALLPAALVGGRIDASVGAVAANAITAAGVASDVGTEIAAAVMAFVPEATGSVTLRQVIAYLAAVLLGKAEEMDDGPTVFYSYANASQARVASSQDGNTRPAPTLTNTGL